MGNNEEVAIMQPSAPSQKSKEVPANRDGEVSLSLGRMKSQSNLEMEANGSVDSEITMKVNLESHRLAGNKRFVNLHHIFLSLSEFLLLLFLHKFVSLSVHEGTSYFWESLSWYY